MRSKSLIMATMLALLLAFATSFIALAHTSIEVGPYTVEVGWVDEPPLVGSKNAVFISIATTADGKPVEGVNTLEVTISTGGKDRKLDVRPLGEDHPGQYAADFIPTRRGVYTVKLSGKIESTDINNNVDIEEAADAGGLQFPEPLPDVQTVNQAASRAESAANSASTSAAIGIIVGGVGVLLGGLALIRSGRSK
jgi:hypothetical protein